MIPAWSDARKLVRQGTTRVSVIANNAEKTHPHRKLSDPTGLINSITEQEEGDIESSPTSHRKANSIGDSNSIYGSISQSSSSLNSTAKRGSNSTNENSLLSSLKSKNSLASIESGDSSSPARSEELNNKILDQIGANGNNNTNGAQAVTISSEKSPLLSKMGLNGGDYDEDDDAEPVWVKPAWLPTDFAVLYLILCSNVFLSSFLVCIPLGIIAFSLGWNSSLIFTFNFLAIIPLAWLLGAATEEIATRTNPTFGGLLNASMGNAVELIVSIIALRRGYIKLVQTSLLGSILSNMLLVLGMSFFLGGLRFRLQNFNRKGAQIFSSMLLLACLAICIPSAYVASFTPQPSLDSVLHISRATASFVFFVYICYLFFQLYTHQDVFEAMEEEEEEESDMSLGFAIVLLSAVTICVGICSEFLVDSIEPITKQWGINESFVGIILIPIVGNACEHATAVTVAMKNKLDLSIGVAIGSSTQIALFLIPFITLLGWLMNEPMTLNFTMFETIVLVLSVVIVNFIIKDGESNWLVGLMLITGYIIIAVAYYYHPDTPENQGDV